MTRFLLMTLAIWFFLGHRVLQPGLRVRHQMIVWNIGQGAWSTEVSDHLCLHYDAGGERTALPHLFDLCRAKQNVLFLSHADQDHIGFAASVAQTFPTCVESLPVGLSPRKKKNLAPIPICSFEQFPLAEKQLLPSKIFDGVNPWVKKMTANDTSRVWISKNAWFVIPGDSPKREEKIWRQKIPHPEKIRVLILGHHGSRTSTAAQTLEKLIHLKMAVASARKIRFGHPHAEVIALLQKYHVALLKTEDWGHLHFLEE